MKPAVWSKGVSISGSVFCVLYGFFMYF
uniref:Uncharacterized protein n=1 Tax=Anguilla anguilla TaxID=7936 RepID=A0A0E9PSW9_ANGAN